MKKPKKPQKPKTAAENSADWLDAHKIENPRQRAFLRAYSLMGNITHAARAAKISRKTYWVWSNSDDSEKFREAFNEAHSAACDALEREAWERAMKGTREPIYWQGKIVGWKFVKDTTLLIFMMKGAMPEKYKDRGQVDLTGKVTLEQLILESRKEN